MHELLSESKQTEAEIVSVALLGAVSGIKAQCAYLTFAAEHAQLACVVDAATQQPIDPRCAEDRRAVQDTVRTRMNAILDPNVGIIHDVELLRTALASSSVERGAILRWNDYFKTTHPFYPDAPYEELVGIGAYYESVHDGDQPHRRGLHGQDAPDRTSADYYVQRHQDKVAEQDELVAEQRSPNDTALDTRSMLTWQKAPMSRFDMTYESSFDYMYIAERTCARAREAWQGGYTK